MAKAKSKAKTADKKKKNIKEVEIEEVPIFDIYGRRQALSAVICHLSAIDISNLNSGVYFVKVVTSEGEAVKRIVKK